MGIIYFLTILIGLVFLLVNERTAKYVLSGYNTLSEIDRNNFDLKGYVQFFRVFLLCLAISYLLIGFVLFKSVDKTPLIIYSVLYPLLGFYLLIILCSKHYNSNKSTSMVLFIGGTTIIAVAFSIYIGIKPANIDTNAEYLKIEGPYGETLYYTDIVEVKKIPKPKALNKVEGFQLGENKKGLFELKNNQLVRVISKKDTCLFLITENENYIIDYDKDLYVLIKSKLIPRQ